MALKARLLALRVVPLQNRGHQPQNLIASSVGTRRTEELEDQVRHEPTNVN